MASNYEKEKAKLDKLLADSVGLSGDKAKEHRELIRKQQDVVRREMRQMAGQEDPTRNVTMGARDEYTLRDSSALTLQSDRRNRAEEVVSDQSEKRVREDVVNRMDKVKIGGKSTVRKETDKQGRIKYRDEIRGTYAKEEAYEDSENRIEMLGNAIRAGSNIGAQGETTNALQFGTAKASATMSKNIGQNAGALQEIFEKEGDETQAELKKLVELMAKAQNLTGKDAEKAKNEISKQTERLKITAGDSGDKISELLGLDNVKKDLRGGSRFKEALNIDQDATGLKAVKQAFSPTRLFGDPNTGGLSGGGGLISRTLGNALGTGDNAADAFAAKQARLEIAQERQAEGLTTAVGEEGLQLTGESTPQLIKENKQKDSEKLSESSSSTTNNNESSTNTVFKSGVDKEPWAEKNNEVLEDILDTLKRIEANGGMGGGGDDSLLDTAGDMMMTRDGKNKRKNRKGKKPGKSRFKLPRMGGAMKLGGALVAGGMALYEGYQGYTAADQLVESGATNEETGQKFTQRDEKAGKTEAVTKAAGGFGGALGGAAAGAAIGSVVPVVGTAIGGLIGGALGYFAGGAAGEAVGDAVTTTSGEAALDAAKESGLYNKNWIGNSEVNLELLKEANDPAQLNAILADNDISDEQKAAVIDQLGKIESGQIEKADMSYLEGDTNNTTTTTTSNEDNTEVKVGGVVVERNGEAVPLSQEDYNMANASIQANVAMGNKPQYDLSKNPIIGQDATATQIEQASAEKGQPVPTGTALENMNDAAGVGDSAPVIVNNNSTQSTPQEPPIQILTNPPSPRPNTTSIERYQDRRYRG